jgi:OOP family OmpA-OmpF porin
MVQSLNKTLEYSVSTKGLRWRWEALTTGKKFAEVVLLHTLRYRVAQIFLIHRESGLLLQHVTDDEDIRDVDLASGMLTAIQDFVRDSFGADETESLKTMAFGNQTIWIETGPRAFRTRATMRNLLQLDR